MMRGLLRACVSFVWLILLSAPAFAQVEVKVFVGGAMTVPVKEAGAAFAREYFDGRCRKGWLPARRPTS